MRPFVLVLRRVAGFLRQLGALGALLLSVRLLWLSCVLGLAYARAPAGDAVRGSEEARTPDPTPAPLRLSNPHRPDLAELSKLAGASMSEPPPEPPAPVPAMRRILVDVGPPRSEVFVGKTRVGHTPYGGQIACLSEDEVKVQILPPQGVPIVRVVACRGDTLLIRD
jgi:hypothetical protein